MIPTLPRSVGHRTALPARAIVPVLAALALLAGCAATPVTPVLLTLPPAVGASTTVSEPPAGAPLLLLRRVALPEYLIARPVRYRADASTLADWPNTYWAERIEVAATREFGSALRSALPGWQLCHADCPDQGRRQSLQVEFLSLDLLRGERLLRARTRISLSDLAASSAATPLRAQERVYDLPTASDTAQAQAEAMTELLRRVARDAAALVGRGA